MLQKLWASIIALVGMSAVTEMNGKKTLSDEGKNILKTKLSDNVLNSKILALIDTESEPEASLLYTLETKAFSELQNQLIQANENYQTIMSLKDSLLTDKQNVLNKLNVLTTQIEALKNQSLSDPNPIFVEPKIEGNEWIAEAKFLFGIQQPQFAIDSKHPYNQRAFSMLADKFGYNVPIATSSLDYSSLSSDLGAYYRVRKQEAILSFIRNLPSVENLFPLMSGFQDEAVLVNMFPSELSQAYQSTFTIKGEFEFQPEKLKMYPVKFDHKFTELKELETKWIGYLNREGSNSMKWSFIEYILSEAAKVLHNEREIRRVKGVRVEPTTGVANSFLHGANGILKFIENQIALYKIKAFDVTEWTSSTIVAHVKTCTGMIKQELLDTNTFKCYMSQSTWIAYQTNYRSLYGQDLDFKGTPAHVMDYPNVPIVIVPNASFKRIWWTYDGNIKCYEDKSGEMYNFNLEQEDRTLKVFSDWKESVWADQVGYAYTSAAEQTYEHQMIFTNTVDDSAVTYIEMVKDDATPSVTAHKSLISVLNTSSVAITNFDNASIGDMVRIKCGTSTNAITIAASGNFSLLSAAWTPSIGDEICFRKRSDGKWIELWRTTSASEIPVFAANDTTPDVSESIEFYTNANTSATTITTLDNAVTGRIYTIHGNGTTGQGQGATGYASYIANSGNFVLTAAMDLVANTWIKLEKSDTTEKFYEISRNS